MLVRVVKWEEHQGRRDHVHPTWFKFSHRTLLSVDDLVIQGGELIAWIYLLCLCNEGNKDTVRVSKQHHSVFGRQSWKEFTEAVDKLKELQWVETEEQTQLKLGTDPALDPHCRTRGELEEKRERQLPRIAILWNERAHQDLARVKECSAARQKNCRERWREHPSDEYWLGVIEQMNRSSFLLGRVPGKTWRVKFDWFIKPDSAIKISEGQYDDRPGSQPEKAKSSWALEQEALNAAQQK